MHATTRTARRALVALMVAAAAGCASSTEGAQQVSPINNQGSVATVPGPVAEVVLNDYSFSIDGPIVPGGELHTRNAGAEVHMFGMGRLAGGKTVADFTAAMEQGAAQPDFGGTIVEDISLPGHILTPGNELRISVPALVPGEYVVGCFVAAEGDGVLHAMKGMVAPATVTGSSPGLMRADATFAIGKGQAVTGPTQLPAGPQRWRLAADGDVHRVQVGLWRLDDGQDLSAVLGEFGEFMGSPTPEPGSGKRLTRSTLFVLHDFAQATETTVGIDLRPGNYVLTGFDPSTLGPESGPVTEQLAIAVS